MNLMCAVPVTQLDHTGSSKTFDPKMDKIHPTKQIEDSVGQKAMTQAVKSSPNRLLIIQKNSAYFLGSLCFSKSDVG